MRTLYIVLPRRYAARVCTTYPPTAYLLAYHQYTYCGIAWYYLSE